MLYAARAQPPAPYHAEVELSMTVRHFQAWQGGSPIECRRRPLDPLMRPQMT